MSIVQYQHQSVNKSYQSQMGCVTSEATNDKRRQTTALSSLRDSKGHPLDDGEAARRKDEKHIEKKLSKEIEQTTKKNEELSKEVARLRKENEIKKKESMESMQSKERELRRLEDEKNRQIQRLRKELEREKSKSKENKQKDKAVIVSGKQKQQQAVGLASLQKHKSLCQQCFYKLARYTETNPNMTECFSCRGYGLVQERFPYGANPSCDKSLCFSKGWDKVKTLRLCSVCQGKGGNQQKAYVPRRY